MKTCSFRNGSVVLWISLVCWHVYNTDQLHEKLREAENMKFFVFFSICPFSGLSGVSGDGLFSLQLLPACFTDVLGQPVASQMFWDNQLNGYQSTQIGFLDWYVTISKNVDLLLTSPIFPSKNFWNEYFQFWSRRVFFFSCYCLWHTETYRIVRSLHITFLSWDHVLGSPHALSSNFGIKHTVLLCFYIIVVAFFC